jgi:hypothetical protein
MQNSPPIYINSLDAKLYNFALQESRKNGLTIQQYISYLIAQEQNKKEKTF